VVLAVPAGGLIPAGVLFSVLLRTGIEPFGTRKLIEGFVFSVEFSFVVLSKQSCSPKPPLRVRPCCCPSGAAVPTAL
jgi:hypothetical protein